MCVRCEEAHSGGRIRAPRTVAHTYACIRGPYLQRKVVRPLFLLEDAHTLREHTLDRRSSVCSRSVCASSSKKYVVEQKIRGACVVSFSASLVGLPPRLGPSSRLVVTFSSAQMPLRPLRNRPLPVLSPFSRRCFAPLSRHRQEGAFGALLLRGGARLRRAVALVVVWGSCFARPLRDAFIFNPPSADVFRLRRKVKDEHTFGVFVRNVVRFAVRPRRASPCIPMGAATNVRSSTLYLLTKSEHLTEGQHTRALARSD